MPGRAVRLLELVAGRGELASRKLHDPRRQPTSATAAAARALDALRVIDPRQCPADPDAGRRPLFMSASRGAVRLVVPAVMMAFLVPGR